MQFVRLLVVRVFSWSFVILFLAVCSDGNSVQDGNIPEVIEPPFSGTAFIATDIITSSDTTTFQSVTYVGQDTRTMYDRRVNNWVDVEAYLFNAEFFDAFTAEIQVNPEFGDSSSAMDIAKRYGTEIGKLPIVLRKDVETVSIHKGDEPFGGGNENVLIHTDRAKSYDEGGFLEEILIHEASHTSLDQDHASSSGWLAAQEADGNFISTYARDNPEREDIAESFLVYLTIRYRADRIPESLVNTIKQTIPNRIDYFDNQSFEISPIEED
jgi:hypothetical protein